MITSLIMDVTLEPIYSEVPANEVQLDQPAYVHPNVLADNLDMLWCR